MPRRADANQPAIVEPIANVVITVEFSSGEKGFIDFNTSDDGAHRFLDLIIGVAKKKGVLPKVQ